MQDRVVDVNALRALTPSTPSEYVGGSIRAKLRRAEQSKRDRSVQVYHWHVTILAPGATSAVGAV
jgi:hypothetical protein